MVIPSRIRSKFAFVTPRAGGKRRHDTESGHDKNQQQPRRQLGNVSLSLWRVLLVSLLIFHVIILSGMSRKSCIAEDAFWRRHQVTLFDEDGDISINRNHVGSYNGAMTQTYYGPDDLADAVLKARREPNELGIDETDCFGDISEGGIRNLIRVAYSASQTSQRDGAHFLD